MFALNLKIFQTKITFIMKRFVLFIVISQLIMFGMAQQKLTPELLWSLGRVGSALVSPDGTKVLYDATFYDVDADRGFRDLYTTDLNGAPAVRITETQFNENAARWLPNGKIVYTSSESGSNQLWIMDADGKNRKQYSNIDGLMEFKFDATGTKLLYTKTVKLDKAVVDVYSDLPKANAKIIDEMMYRHWDSWHDLTYNHVFIAELKGEQWVESKDIMTGERFDTPLKPSGGIEQVAWSPDGKLIAYACKKKVGKAYAMSTNSEIYLYNTETGTTENISEGYMGYDLDPIFSPDGTKIIWTSMERDGFEADKARLILYDVKAKTKTDLSQGFDQSVSNLSFSPDSKQIFMISGIRATYQIFSYDLKAKKFAQITKGVHNYLDYDFAGKFLVATKQSMSMPTEVFKVEIATGTETQLTFVNKKTWDGIKLAEVKERTVKTTDGKDMLVWVVYPPNFDPNKKYPTLLYCQGGPQSAVSQFFSYRWNMQLIAANDYIIVAPNRRGLPTFGQEWNDQISKDYGGQNMQDYLSA
ncbi:MAG TPA: peptidase S9, partial [Bacteroidales bacterium]|nr:peptidase S9 [Bacteroidales bacterium]